MFVVNILGNFMKFCYELFSNYGIAIILFTLFSKLVLLPISIMVQKNSIKMVRMQPEINKIKINYFGDKDTIADEQAKLYKKEKYNPLTSLVPLVIQIVLLMVLVEVINHPLTYIVKTPNDVTEKFVQVAIEANKLDEESTSLELSVVNDIKEKNNIELYEAALEELGEDSLIIDEIESVNLSFLGFDLSWVAANQKGLAILIPVIAGLSALALCIAQNKMNVLQTWQEKSSQYGMLVFSVGLSLYLGIFVPAGVALYWTASNLFAILQQWLLNIFINPKKYVDFEELEKTGNELKELANTDKKNGKRTREQIKKEKQDYKRFFSILNKHLVFYSESNGFYKYYKGIIEYILKNTNITIHYITSDYNDKIFEMEKENKQIKAYYIEEKKLITMMMKMDCDVFVMTMPDIDNYHIKRSYVNKNIEYVYVQHGMDSLNMTLRTKALNNYDSIFVSGKHQKEEMEKLFELYDLKDKVIIEQGYNLLDDMIENYEKTKKVNKEKTILIAPSWQKDNIVDLCLDEMLENLKKLDYKIIVRPHPQHVRHMKSKFDNMKEVYKDNKNIVIQTDFSSSDTVFNSDLVITDWSSIATEFAFTTKKPVIFIDSPMKVMNPDYKKIDVEPINIWCRNEIGKVIELDKLDTLADEVEKMLKEKAKYKKKITKLTEEYVYNLGKGGEVGAKYIIEAVKRKIKERREK